MRLKDYAEQKNISYLTAWKHWKKGRLEAQKGARGNIIVKKVAKPPAKGRPAEWSKEKVVSEVYKLCRGRYVKACHFPPYLYDLCLKFCGSVRAAKWEAKIIHGRSWSYEKFIKCLCQFCRKRYREPKDWPPNMRALAKQFCGSIRKAKWEAGVILDQRKKIRRSRSGLQGLWTKEKFLRWVCNFCEGTYKKPAQWPGYMRELAVRYCGSVRGAKHEAKILSDPRKIKR